MEGTMDALPEQLQKVVKDFRSDIETLFTDHVVSMSVYGSAATEEYKHKKSDINVLVVLDESAIQNLQPAQKKSSKWQKMGVQPLFLTEAYIERSLDSFPIEFMNMKAAYHHVGGRDLLAGLEFDRGDLRLQCERELKGNLLHLRQRYVMTQGRKSELLLLIKESIVAFSAIFRALLFLKGREIPSNKPEVILQTCKEFGLDVGLFSRLISVRKGDDRPSPDELGNLVASYIRQIRTLSQYVDTMEL
jgi:predicted nucleotidyltransferase